MYPFSKYKVVLSLPSLNMYSPLVSILRLSEKHPSESLITF